MNEYEPGKTNIMCPKCNRELWVDPHINGKCKCGNKYKWERTYSRFPFVEEKLVLDDV